MEPNVAYMYVANNFRLGSIVVVAGEMMLFFLPQVCFNDWVL